MKLWEILYERIRMKKVNHLLVLPKLGSVDPSSGASPAETALSGKFFCIRVHTARNEIDTEISAAQALFNGQRIEKGELKFTDKFSPTWQERFDVK